MTEIQIEFEVPARGSTSPASSPRRNALQNLVMVLRFPAKDSADGRRPIW
ncbi:hypothetical protein [Streptomyces sp. NPDC002845]